jgi:hypothetical protein
MVLLVTAAERRRECAGRIGAVTGEVVHTVPTLGHALGALRSQTFTVVVIDQSLMWEGDGKLADLLAGTSGMGTMLVVNLAISGMERVVFEVRAALRRRQRELLRAREEAEGRLRAELNEAITGILLSSQLALDDAAVPGPVSAKIRSVYELAMSMRDRLRMA